MGNLQNKLRPNPDDEPFEELEQEIVSMDMPMFPPPIYEQVPDTKPISNLKIPNLKFSKSVFILKKDSVKVTPTPPKFIISFEYDADEKCNICFKFGQTHMGLTNGVPSFSIPKYGTAEIELKVGKHLKFSLDHSLISKMNGLTLEYCSFTSERRFVPILMVISSLESEFKYYVMCGLKMDYSRGWDIFVTKRRIQVGDFGYQVQEVFGLNESEYNNKAQENESSVVKRCSICLDKPANTILMPCRHMCLCSDCSISLSVQIGKCPMCRTIVTQILHIDKDRTQSSPV